jgi:hypothetical protein
MEQLLHRKESKCGIVIPLADVSSTLSASKAVFDGSRNKVRIADKSLLGSNE